MGTARRAARHHNNYMSYSYTYKTNFYLEDVQQFYTGDSEIQTFNINSTSIARYKQYFHPLT